MLISAAVLPHPPILVPELAAGRARTAVDEVREACRTALEAVRLTEPDAVVLVGASEHTRRFSAAAVADFAPWGGTTVVGLPGHSTEGDSATAGAERLPLSLAVGAWLLHEHGWSTDVALVSIGDEEPEQACISLGAELAGSADRVALIVMGDGSAHRSSEGPRPFDPRAEGFDASVAAALASGDPEALVALDTALAAELDADGPPAWRVLAGAGDDSEFDADVLYSAAPYGVGYLIAVWERHG